MVGTKLGNYRIVRLLGEGGMGRVYEAVDDQIERRAAIKVLHAQFAHNSEAFTRFLNEARAVNIVQHPGVVNVYEFGQTEDGSPYIVMEFLDGEPLDKRIARLGRLSLSGLRIARQIASALVAAHAKHIVHRDLKPSNVMLVPDPDMPGGERVKVVDFGIAKLSSEHNPGGHKTRAGAILGTPTYMSPEQCRGAGEVTDKTDIYALGVMLYEMLSGRPPFVADGEGEVMGMHLFHAPPPLHGLEPTLPLDLVDLVHTMLAKDPAQRPAIAEVARQLDRIGQRYSGESRLPPELAAIAAQPKPPGPMTLPLDEKGRPKSSMSPEIFANDAEGAAQIRKSGPQTPTLAGEKIAGPAPDVKLETAEAPAKPERPRKRVRWPLVVAAASLVVAVAAVLITIKLTRQTQLRASGAPMNQSSAPPALANPSPNPIPATAPFGPPAEAAPIEAAPKLSHDGTSTTGFPARSDGQDKAPAPVKKAPKKQNKIKPSRERLELLD